MSLFQRIRTPFGENADDSPGRPEPGAPSVGEQLRERREGYGLDLDSVGEALCIKPVYLAALEQGRAQDLPGPTYAAGFIRAYAQYLGLDGERVLESYKAESAAVQARPDLALPVPLDARGVPGGPILMAAAVLALCGYAGWYYLSADDRSRPERVAAVPAVLRQEAQPLLPPASGAPEPTASQDARPVSLASGLAPPQAAAEPALAAGAPAGENAAPVAENAAPAADDTSAAAAPAHNAVASAATPPAAGDASVKPAGQVEIKALADCWIQVRAPDQSIVFSRVLKAGETYRVPRAGLLLRTGNAGALAVAVDGKPAPALGPPGALRRSVALDPEALLAGTAVHG